MQCSTFIVEDFFVDTLVFLVVQNGVHSNPIDTGRKLNVHKTFRRRPGRLLNVLFTFSLHPVSTGNFIVIARRHGRSAVNLLHLLRTPLPKNTSNGLLLQFLRW